jgi:hypothetical protein
MKKIFLFGRITRIFFLMSFGFLLYAFVDMCIQSEFAIKNVLFLLLVVLFVAFGVFWIYLPGVEIDRVNGKVKLILGLSSDHVYERIMDDIASLDVEKESNIGMHFIIRYKNGYSQKLLYRFYRVSFIEEIQFKRIKRELAKLKF